jgi:uncharacterized protein (DUF433 family)
MELLPANYIISTPDVRFGKPRIAGRRVAVIDIAFLYAHIGSSAEEIAAEYELPLAAVHAALSYYYDHRPEIEKSLADDEAFAEAMSKEHPSILVERLRH